VADGRPVRPGSKPLAVLVAGDPATGKSTLGALLAVDLGAAILDLDVLTGPLTETVARLAGVGDLSDPVLVALTRDARYATLLDVAEAILGVGLSAVLVAPFSAERHDEARWEEVRARLESAGARVTLVWLRLGTDELLARLAARDAARDAAKIADPQSYVAGLDRSAPVGPHLSLDAAAPAAELVRSTLRYLSS
jgi:predicted kinase